MKKLHLIRHAKSSWDHPNLSDQQRPLNQRGLNDCAIMAQALFKQGIEFPEVFVSSAQRAQLTIMNIAAHWQGQPINWQVRDDLYEFSSAALNKIIAALFEHRDELMIVGHNPALTDLINDLTGANITNFATCAYACITAEVLSSHQGSLLHYDKPKMFK